MRVLQHADEWLPILRLPRPRSGDTGAFAPLSRLPSVHVEAAGLRQNPGATRSTGPLKVMRFAFSALAESARLRLSPSFVRADLVHANTSRAAVYGALACLVSNKSFIVHLRDLTTVDSLGALGNVIFTKVVLRRANGVIANSRTTLASAEPYLRRAALRYVIPSPIGFDRDHVPAKSGKVVQVIGMVARIDSWKGHELLLEAFASSCRGTRIRLVLAGGAAFGKDETLVALTDKARMLGIADQVDFLGHVSDVRGVIDRMDICVQASTRPEPLGQNVLQYLASGKPVVAINAGGPSEWIISGENGLLAEMGSIESMASALRLLIDDASLRDRIAKGAKRTKGIMSDADVAAAHGLAFAEVKQAGRSR